MSEKKYKKIVKTFWTDHVYITFVFLSFGNIVIWPTTVCFPLETLRHLKY
jgi:hypothetical protein